MKKVRHVLGISGGKDSAALAIYMKTKYPNMDIEFYTSDTGKELDETYQLIKNLEVYLGLKINILRGAENSSEDPFDHFLKMYGGFLPSPSARWCTKKMKLEPFEKYVGDDMVVSYVGIRGDEDREGYISTKLNIQSIFPFRRNIWSKDVILDVLHSRNLETVKEIAKGVNFGKHQDKATQVIATQISNSFTINAKLNALLDIDIQGFNNLVFEYIVKSKRYPLSYESYFPLVENEDILVKEDIFRILKESGVGVPEYYNKVEFEVDGKKGKYARSRSGCYFCFYQQKIEWIWLYEQHPDLFQKAMDYEKNGYKWTDGESLADLIKPERIKQIKLDYIKRTQKKPNIKSPFLIDILDDADDEGCASCFI